MVVEAESKVTNAIYKVIRTKGDMFALATASGLKFAKLNGDRKSFVLQKDILLAETLLTQVTEVAQDIFLVGCWGQPWAALCSKKTKAVQKIPTPSLEETQTTNLILLPGFSLRSFPFAIMRTNKSLNLVDL